MFKIFLINVKGLWRTDISAMYTDIVTILLEASKPHFNQEGRKEKRKG